MAHAELADFLRSRRERLSPSALGLSNGRRRRTPGLRREEVAERAGIGVDWYIRLEQGRAVSPSAGTVDALAQALCLSAVDHAHLRILARHAQGRGFTPECVPDTLWRLVDALPLPAYVTGRRWDILAWNDAADAMFGFARLPPARRNTLLFVLTDPEARRMFGTAWEPEVRRMIAQFRRTHDLWADDPAFMALLDDLRKGCSQFAAWWNAHDIHDGGSGRKTLHHPTLGVLHFAYATFQAIENPALKLAIYTPITDDQAAA